MNARILIVEDERLVARELRLRLEAAGYRIAGTVATGDAALQSATDEVPDAVLMDIRIQGDRDGIETAALLVERFDVPVVFLTSHSDDATLQRAKAIGAAGFLVKPPKERDLVVAIEVALHKHEMIRQLRTREKWFSTTLRSIGDAVISTDASGNISFMNPVAETLTGWRAEDARGQPSTTIVKFARTSGEAEPPIAEILRRRQTIYVDGELTDQQGRTRSVADSAAPIIDDAGSLLGGVIVFRDVTEQRALERQLESAERLASLGTLAAGVAHEINNPLTWVITNLAHLAESLGDPTLSPDRIAALRDDARDALGGAERIQRIVRDLAIFSRRAPERSTSAVAEAVRQGLASVMTSVYIAMDLDPRLHVAMDASRLAQVIANVVTNAHQAMADAPSAEHRITITAASAASRVVITIADTGPGMPEAVRSRVFDPFFTTRTLGRGSGLGLSIAHGLVTAAGGTIEIASTVGQGTTCTITLPVAPVPASEPAPATTATPPERAKVLVIDDEDTMRRIMRRMLRDHDATVLDAPEALELLRQGERFDVVLCDLMMPSISGIDLYQEVLALDPAQATRFVFSTGGAFNMRSAEFLASTSCQVLEKPFRPQDLYALLPHYIAKRTPPR